MRMYLLFVGILFAVAMVIINLYLVLKNDIAHVQLWYCWSVVSLCGTLIYNGSHYFLQKKKGICMINVGVIILGVLVFTFLF
ncbi:hypothetical protein D3C75_627320 [compost metagenome]